MGGIDSNSKFLVVAGEQRARVRVSLRASVALGTLAQGRGAHFFQWPFRLLVHRKELAGLFWPTPHPLQIHFKVSSTYPLGEYSSKASPSYYFATVLLFTIFQQLANYDTR